MEDLLTCSVCCEKYTEVDRHPVLLPRCGHSFCRPCTALLTTGGCITCPTCRTDQRIEYVDRLPTEFSLLAIIRAQESAKLENCKHHDIKLSFWCRTCLQSACGECLFEDHPTHSHDVVRAARYITEMKQNAQEIIDKFMEALDFREQNFYKTIFNCARRISNGLRNVNILRKDMEEARNLMKGIKERETINSATSLSEAAKFLGSKWNIQDANYKRIKKVEKEQRVKEEKERESPKANESTENDSNLPDNKTEVAKVKQVEKKEEKESKKPSLLRKSKTLSAFEPMSKSPEIPEAKEPQINTIDNKEREKIEEKVEEKKLTEEKKDESKKEPVPEIKPERIIDTNVVKPRGRLARKALAQRAATMQLVEDEEKVKKEIINESANVDALDLQTSAGATATEPNEQTDSTKRTKKKDEGANNITADDSETKNESEANTENSTEKNDEDVPEEDKKLQNEESSILDAMSTIPDGKLIDFLQVPGFMVCVESTDGKLANLEWGPQGLHVFCHQFQQIPYDIVIKSSILSSMIPSKNPMAFMELSADDTVIGRIYIQLWGRLQRAHNFLTLCLGDHGVSYLQTKFLQVYNRDDPGERILGGDYEFNTGRGGRGIIDDLEWNGDYSTPMTEGMITAAGSGQDANNSLFLICTKGDESRNFSCPFGLVCEGLNVIKKAVCITADKDVYVSDCGIVLEPPKF